MDVARREKFFLTRGDPAFPRRSLALRAVPVAAGVVRDGAMSAASAFIEMAAECGGATLPNGQQHFDVLPTDPLTVSFDECVARDADEIGHLQRRPAHLFVPVLVFQLQRIQGTGGRVKMTPRKMQVDGGLFQIAMAQQDLNGAEIGTRFEQMSGEAVAQRVRMNSFLEVRALGGFMTRMPNGFRIDGLATVMVAVAWKQPDAWFSSQAVPVLAQFFEQLGAEQHIAISAPFAALDVNDHALAVDVGDFQVRQLRVADAGGIQRHHDGAMEGSAGRVDKLRDFSLAQDRRQTMGLFRIRRLRDAPAPLERLGVEKTQGRQTYRHSARRQLPLLKQFGLVFANVPRAQTVR